MKESLESIKRIAEDVFSVVSNDVKVLVEKGVEYKDLLLQEFQKLGSTAQFIVSCLLIVFACFVMFSLLNFAINLFFGRKKINYENNSLGEEVSEVPISQMETAPVLNKKEKKQHKLVKISNNIKKEESSSKPEDYQAERKTIFVVDDSMTILAKVTKQLKEKYNVITANSGFEALRKIETIKKPDLILSDIEMPPDEKGKTCDGFELLSTLQSSIKYSSIPVILMTANLDIAAERGFDLGAKGFLSKPFEKEIMFEQIDYCLNNM